MKNYEQYGLTDEQVRDAILTPEETHTLCLLLAQAAGLLRDKWPDHARELSRQRRLLRSRMLKEEQ